MSEAPGRAGMPDDSQAERLLLPFPPGCVVARLVRREKRFTIVAKDTASGADFLAHTNNTGSMLGLLAPGTPALLSPALNQDRKLRWTLEALALPGAAAQESATARQDRAGCPQWRASSLHAVAATPRGVVENPPVLAASAQEYPDGPDLCWAGVNTQTPNRLLEAAFHAGLLPQARGYAHLRREAKTGDSRLDALLTPEVTPEMTPGREDNGQRPLPPLYVECKNVTLVQGGLALFPDAPTERGRKHLAELTRLVHEGCRAALFFLVQRPDGQAFAPAAAIDPDYARDLAAALAAGVEAWVWRARITKAGIHLAERLPLSPAWVAGWVAPGVSPHVSAKISPDVSAEIPTDVPPDVSTGVSPDVSADVSTGSGHPPAKEPTVS